MDFFELSKQTYIENWPEPLFRESIATVYFRLNSDQIDTLISANAVSMECNQVVAHQKTILLRIEERIDSYIRQFPNGAFIRLGSRSPKDSFLATREGFQCRTGRKALSTLLDSERVYEDLQLARTNNYNPSIVVREWLNIEPWQEFRCFYKNRQLKGVSQYFYNKSFPQIAKYKDSIVFALQIKSERVKNLLPLEDIVVDYVYRIKERSNERESRVILLELNPFGVWTDPCLFNWSKDNFESFDFRISEDRNG